MSLSVQKKIEAKLDNAAKGSMFFIADFSVFGTDVAIRQSLQRLCKKDVIIRLAKGIYYYPKSDELFGIIKPSAEIIAESIAKRDKARILPTGSYALYKLGLSTQIPMNVVYLTDGSPRKIQVGNQKIAFRKTSPKNLAANHHLTALIIQGLKELGEGNIDSTQFANLAEIINQANENTHIKENIRYAPVWIQKIVLKIIEEMENE